MNSSTIDQDSLNIINEKTQLEYETESFQKYLDLPWDDLGRFNQTVKGYEEKFQKDLKEHLEAQSKNPKDEDGKLAINRFYLRNVFHVFNHPSAESPTSLQSQLKLTKFLDIAINLLRQRGWSGLKDNVGHGLDISNTLKFLCELTTRIFNLNHVFPTMAQNLSTESMTLHSRYSELLPGLDKLDLRLVKESDVSIMDNLYETYYHYFNPQRVFANKFSTAAFRTIIEQRGRKYKNKRHNLKDELFLRIRPYLTDLFVDAILPNYYKARGSTLEANTDSAISTHSNRNSVVDSLSQNDVLLNNALQMFDVALTNQTGRPDICLQLEDVIFFEKDFERNYKVCSIEIIDEKNLAELAKTYFRKQELLSRNKTRESSSDTGRKSYIDKNDDNASDGSLSFEALDDLKKNSMTGEKFYDYLVEITSHCKLNGTPLCVLTNLDDMIVVRVRDFSEKVSQDVCEESPKDSKLFDQWDVTIYDRAKTKYSTMSIFSALVLDGCKNFLEHQIMTNSQISNWYITHGANNLKQTLDKIRYLTTRRIFYLLMKKKVPTSDMSQISTQWSNNIDWNDSGLTFHAWSFFVKKVVSNVKESEEWKTYQSFTESDWRIWQKEKSKRVLKVLNSSHCKISETLQNEAWCDSPGATIMAGVLGNATTTTLLKIYDVNRMPISSGVVLSSEGYMHTADFQTILEMSFKCWLKELTAYHLLKGKEYVPSLIDCGFLFIPDLEPTTLKKKINLYENMLERTGRELKTEAPFLLMDCVEELDTEGMLDINFDELEQQAKEDLDDMHRHGVVHCDLHGGNILIKKTNLGDYKVMFIDFGQSISFKTLGENNDFIEEWVLSDKEELSKVMESYKGRVSRYRRGTK